MPLTHPVLTRVLTRRAFLALAGAGVVATATGCSDDDDDTAPTTLAPTTLAPTTATTSLEIPSLPAGITGELFTLGVASGDPRADSIVLWTRLVTAPLDLGGGMPGDDVDVAWEVASSSAFGAAELVATGVATARADQAHSLHVVVDGLAPDTEYHYRFRIGDQASPTGRTRTFPADDSSPERLRFAMATCQDRASGYYGAYRGLVNEPDLTLIVFLGDYIYEFGGPETAGPTERVNLGPVPTTLDDYRRRYAQYKTDLDLQGAHAAAPWLVIWDDHEVENNYERDQPGPTADPVGFLERRAAAYQAWWEHQPTRLPAPEPGGELRLYGEMAYGDLVRFLLLDVHQYGDPIPCRDTSVLDEGNCATRDDETRSILGADQEEWLHGALGTGTTTWNAITQGVMLAGLNTGGPGGEPRYFLETWDGYPGARRRGVEDIAASGVRNPVVLTGDYHASFVNDVRAIPTDLSQPVVATEFLVTSISTFTFATDYTAENPHVQYFDPRNGYAICDVTPAEWRTQFKYVDDVTDPNATLTDGPTFLVRDGTPTAERVS